MAGCPPTISREISSMRETGEVSDEYTTIKTFETWEWVGGTRERDTVEGRH